MNKIAQRSQLARQAEQDVINAARACLQLDQFQHYRMGVEKLTSVLLDEMKRVPFTDPQTYGCIMFDYVNRIKNAEALLLAVEEKARK